MGELKQSAGRGPQHLRPQWIDTTPQPNRIDVSGQSCPQESAQIAGILNPIQHQDKVQLGRNGGESIQADQAGDTIGCDRREGCPEHLIGDEPPAHLGTSLCQIGVTLQPHLGGDDFLRSRAPAQNLLQQVGALEKQQPFGLTPSTGCQGSQPFDQGIASAADQREGSIQRTAQNAACLRTFNPL